MMEQLDLYDRQRQSLGRTHRRGAPMKKEEWLLATAVWVVTPGKKILVTFRDPAKKVLGGYWENPGGAAQAEEDSRQAVVRELAEETGIIAKPEEFRLLCTRHSHPLIFDTYGLYKEISIEDIVLEPKETADARLVTLEELKDMVRGGKFPPPIEKELREYQEIYYRFYNSLP